MTTYGLTSTGFVPKTLEIIRGELNTALRAAFGQALKLHDSSAFGKLVGIFSERFALLWELAEAIYSSQDPDAALTTALEALCALTGTVREAAHPSTVLETMTGTPGTTITLGAIVRVDGTTVDFETTKAVDIELAPDWIVSTSYAVDDWINNSSNIYICITAGVSAPSGGGPSSTSQDITDGTAHWRYVGPGTGYVQVTMESSEDGPITGLAGTITDIQTVISGWSSAQNFDDADLGDYVETDEDLRVRREDELAGSGEATLDAIRAALLDVDGVTSVTVFQNTTDVTNSDGMPPHSVEALVIGGDDDDIAQALFDTVAAGIATHSSSSDSATVTDSAGNVHTIYFSRPTEVPIYVAIDIDVDASLYPDDGDTQVAAAIALAYDSQSTGKDGVANTAIAAAMGIAGVLDVTDLDVDDTDPPSGIAKIVIGTREITTCSSADVDVTSTPVTP